MVADFCATHTMLIVPKNEAFVNREFLQKSTVFFSAEKPPLWEKRRF